jgi:hypothetical protein
VGRVHNSPQEDAGIRSVKVYAGEKDVVARFGLGTLTKIWAPRRHTCIIVAH